MSDKPKPLGEVKFILLHHSGCPRTGFHYQIDADGSIRDLLADDTRGQHPHSIGIVVEGNFDETKPGATQINALKQLILDLKLKYPTAELGAHRQVRGDKKTTCPGRKFPVKQLLAWSRSKLIEERDAQVAHIIEIQYGP